MIVPMKKITLIVQDKDAGPTLLKLRSLGLLHIEHQRIPIGGDISRLQDDIALVDQAIGILSAGEFIKQPVESGKEPRDWKFSAHHIIDMHKRIDQLQEYSRTLQGSISQWLSWGDFEPQDIKNLSERNIYVRFYQIPLKEIKNLPGSVIVKKVAVVGGIANCVIISHRDLKLPFKELNLPKMSLKRMQSRLAEDIRLIASIKDEINQHRVYLENFLRTRKSLEKELEFQRALKGMGEAGKILYLTGYAPYDRTDELLDTARKEKWGIWITEPSEEDRVPTLIRNPAWVRVIRPIFKLIEVVPGYRELDISLWFLVFFSVFFGILIGDAAYGAIFFSLTFLAQKKWGKKLKEQSVFTLFYILSSFAIIWGILSGTFFGQEWLPGWVKPVIPALRDSQSVQRLCFFLGALHLSIAHLWRGIVKLPSFKALSELGWVLILWTAFLLAQFLILGDNFPGFGIWLLISGAVLVLIFTNPRKNIIKGIGQGLGNLLLNLINNFTDIVSYIRLFAVGLATVAVADSFNKMAMEVGFNNFASGILTAFILLLGHALNIILGPMSILVHGVRLNVLEFCNHLDIKWSGLSYQPLKEETAT